MEYPNPYQQHPPPTAPGPPQPPPQPPAWPQPVSGTPVSPGYQPVSPYPTGYQQPPPMFVNLARPTSGLATASLVLGIVGVLGGWCMFGIPCILAVIFGHAALPATKDGTVGGRGLAIAGLVLGYVLVIPMIIFTLMLFFGAAASSVSDTGTTY